MSPYAYVAGNPVNAADPTGKSGTVSNAYTQGTSCDPGALGVWEACITANETSLVSLWCTANGYAFVWYICQGSPNTNAHSPTRWWDRAAGAWHWYSHWVVQQWGWTTFWTPQAYWCADADLFIGTIGARWWATNKTWPIFSFQNHNSC